MDNDAEVARLKAEDEARLFPGFDESDAIELGGMIVARAVAAKAPVVIDIRTPNRTLFHAALPGSGPLNDLWARRKSNVAFLWGASSLRLRIEAQVKGQGVEVHGLDPAEHAFSGGSVPVKVRGTGVVAAVTVSGLPDVQDHALVIAAMEEFLATRGGAVKPGKA